ncbi:MAG: class I SAM-dependent methyltransferase [Alphaproteobacteria bacterium]|nr:class I SAM-dependent methyltransferase [Alphaproteobacteria bacterium]
MTNKPPAPPILNVLPNVKAQYEAYPFPQRDPEDERKRLHISEYDSLARINHYVFGGRQDFRHGFHALVAGGGTGDATIFLAAQLKPLGGRVTYLDMSAASLAIARARAEVRGLDNVTFVHGSILDLPMMGLAPFDYISCTGVLHHLADPLAGLRPLEAVLAADGGMCLMLYGRYGRRDIYFIQDLVRLALAEVSDLGARVEGTIALLRSLPRAHPFFRGQDPQEWLARLENDKANLFDTFLHEQDSAYSVPEIYAFLASGGLKLVAFTNFQRKTPVYRLQYDPAYHVEDAQLLQTIRRRPLIEQQAVAEILDGTIGLHTFYASRRAAQAALGPDMIPFFAYSDVEALARAAVERKVAKLSIDLWNGKTLRYRCAPHTLALLAAIDGKRSCGQILAEKSTGDANACTQELERLLRFFNDLDWMLLRHANVPPFPPLPMYRARTKP